MPDETEMKITPGPRRPLVRYHGGKWKLAPWIIANLPPHRIYTESYGGGGSVLLRKSRSYAEVYNDLDGEMVNLFQVVRDHPKKLRRLLKWTPFSRDDYKLAHEPCGDDDPIEMARRTIVRSHMGFGSNAINRAIQSGFRANSNRSGTTPAHDWKNYPVTIHAAARRLRGVVLENRPAAQVMLAHDSPETLHYVDPPYVHSSRSYVKSHGAHGYSHEMSDADHRELAGVLHGLAGMVILSGYQCELYQELYGDWHSLDRPAHADGALERTEFLWFNNAAWESLSNKTANLFTGAA